MDLLDEDEQWDALKRWIRTNGPQVLIMVAVALLAAFGWKWWKSHQDNQAQAARAMYQKILADFDEEKMDVADAGIETLRRTYPKSAYVSAADLAAASAHVNFDELDKAAVSLERVATSARDKNLRPIARLRLARVQAAQGKYDVALSTLGTENMGSQQSAYLEVRGDVLFAKGDHAGALQAYEESRKLLSSDQAGPDGVAQILDLKISDLKAAT